MTTAATQAKPKSPINQAFINRMASLAAPAKSNPETGALLELVHTVITNGIPLYVIKGLTKKQMDAAYAAGYNLYSEEKYEEALGLFRWVSFYNHLDKRAWKGFAGCSKMLKQYDAALEAYIFTNKLDDSDPTLFFHAYECQLGLNKPKEALTCLESTILRCSTKPEYASLKKWSESLRDNLQESINKNEKK